MIGGVVDRQTRKPGASLHRADSSGIRPVRIPTAGVLETPQKADALSCLACVQAMMAFHAGARPSWGDAFVAAPAMWCAPASQVCCLERRLRTPEQAKESPEVPRNYRMSTLSHDGGAAAALILLFDSLSTTAFASAHDHTSLRCKRLFHGDEGCWMTSGGYGSGWCSNCAHPKDEDAVMLQVNVCAGNEQVMQ